MSIPAARDRAAQLDPRRWLFASLLVLSACIEEHGGDLHAPDSPPAPEVMAEDGAPRLARLEPVGVHAPGSAVEIAAFDASSARLFVTNGETSVIDVVDLHDPRAPERVATIDVSRWGQPTSVDVSNGLVAIAVAATPSQAPGTVLFLRAGDLGHVNQLRVGPLPDNLGFSPDGSKLVVACEGEPSTDLRDDPPGAIAIIDIDEMLAEARDADVRFVEFDELEFLPLDPDIHIGSHSAGVAADLEPEFVAISADSRTAWISLQENNALAIVDLEHARLRELVGLGETALSRPELGHAPVFAMRQPDAIVGVEVGGREFIVSANEGDCRNYAAVPELTAAADLPLDPVAFPDAALLQRDDVFGRLAVSSELGDLDHDGDYDELHGCGSRSISVWTDAGELIWDSGALLDQLAPAPNPGGSALDFGPSPEGVVAAELWGRPYVFVGLEGSGGIAVFELSDPSAPELVTYEHSTGDLGPEGLEFVSAADSPIDEPLLIAANELSRTVRIYRIVSAARP